MYGFVAFWAGKRAAGAAGGLPNTYQAAPQIYTWPDSWEAAGERRNVSIFVAILTGKSALLLRRFPGHGTNVTARNKHEKENMVAARNSSAHPRTCTRVSGQEQGTAGQPERNLAHVKRHRAGTLGRRYENIVTCWL